MFYLKSYILKKTSVMLGVAYDGAVASIHGSGAQPGMAYDRPKLWQLATATGSEYCRGQPQVRAKL